MRHLTTEELLDLAEGASASESAEQGKAHLASCARCADELARAQAALAIAREPLNADVPDPSPLFWDHLSARVRESVAAEPPPRASWFDVSWGWRTLVPVAGALALVVAVFLRLGDGGDQSRVAANTPATTEKAIEVVQASQGVDDPALALLVDLAGDFEWDDVADTGLMAGSGAIDRAMSELSADERVELHRLLNEELKQWKTPGV